MEVVQDRRLEIWAGSVYELARPSISKAPKSPCGPRGSNWGGTERSLLGSYAAGGTWFRSGSAEAGTADPGIKEKEPCISMDVAKVCIRG